MDTDKRRLKIHCHPCESRDLYLKNFKIPACAGKAINKKIRVYLCSSVVKKSSRFLRRIILIRRAGFQAQFGQQRLIKIRLRIGGGE